MSLHAYGQAVEVLRYGRDAFDDPTELARFTVTDCGIIRHATDEDRDGAHVVTETGTVAMPSDTDVRADDQLVMADGTRWHVNGRPRVPENPLTGWQPALSVPIRRVTG